MISIVLRGGGRPSFLSVQGFTGGSDPENGNPELVSGSFGFTLAEVLITLGIIGVVAALTLPTLNQAVNKRVRAEQIGKCMGAPFTPKPVTRAECEQMKADGMVSFCYYTYDYFAGAVKQCGGKSNMPTMADLGKIASAIYEGNPSIGANQDVTGLTYKDGTATSLGLPEPSFYLWAGVELNSSNAYNREFSPTYSYRSSNYGSYRGVSGIQAVCLAD